MGRSPWYTPGSWKLPDWWTMNPPGRKGYQLTKDEQEVFFNGWFVKTVLKHTGGMNTLPEMK